MVGVAVGMGVRVAEGIVVAVSGSIDVPCAWQLIRKKILLAKSDRVMKALRM
jgi:hypothetical protein